MHLTILGGGVSGLAAAMYAQRRRSSFVVYEGRAELGGHAVTFERDGLRYDSGAHRLHDKNPGVSTMLRDLIGDELETVVAPSRIYRDGRSVEFPLSPVSLVRGLSAGDLLRAVRDVARARVSPVRDPRSFAELAVSRYGRTLAERFLLSYSEKLWGLPPRDLALEVAGGRLDGLSFRGAFRDLLRAGPRGSRHLEGAFLYPRRGIGRICEAMAEACPAGSLVTGAQVTAIEHDGKRVHSVRIGNGSRRVVDEVVCTLPLTVLLRLLRPAPPPAILALASALRFRSIVLVAAFIEVDRVSRYASTYFPERQIPFTRVHEPKCRGADMAPVGRTCLAAELPCGVGDATWCAADADLAQRVVDAIVRLGLVPRHRLSGTAVHRMPSAYPVLGRGATTMVQEARDWLVSLANLHLVGRASTFQYLHIHDLIESARGVVEHLAATRVERGLLAGMRG